jgi:transposase
MERISMTTKERQRAAVLQQVVSGSVTLRSAMPHLGVSYRQAKRLLNRFRRDGARGIRHGNLGRRSNRAWASAEREAILELIRTYYSGPVAGAGQRFGPTLAAEHLWTEHGKLIAVPTLRRWMLGAGLWSRQRRARPAHVRRPRRDGFGELLQLDGSFHDWFEGRGPRPCLVSLVDDATGTMLGRFSEEETTWAAAAVLRAWIEQYGVPRALYVDAKTVYVRPATSKELITGRAPRTQFGRMCARLGIELITARSPQAKGRVERNHGTNQDRLVKKLRRQQLATIDAANAFLGAAYVADHNTRFARPVGLDVHTPLARGVRLDEVFALEEERTLGNDWIVQYKNQALQVRPTRAAQRHVAPGRRVLVRESERGTLRVVVVHPETGREHELAWELATMAHRIQSVRQQAVHATTSEATRRPPVPAPAPAGYTSTGKPLSAKQMAVRARWNQQTAAEINRRRALATVNKATTNPAHP